jgi:hypothetical protein
MELPQWVLKIAIGVLFYFLIINTLIYFQYKQMFTPEQWLYHPILNIMDGNILAIFILLLCLVVGWMIIESE